jgi:hypothetical protein
MALVPRECTPRTPVEVALDLRAGYWRTFGRAPGKNTLATGYAQCALETGWGEKLYGYNYGNISAGASWKNAGKDYNVLRCAERLDIKNHPETWTNVEMRFRVHADPVDGAADYWGLLSSCHYAPVLILFASGAVAAATHQLSALGYFTAHVEDTVNARGERVPGYASNMVAIQRTFLDHILPKLPPDEMPAGPVLVDPLAVGEAQMHCLLTTEEAQELSAEQHVMFDTLIRSFDFGSPMPAPEPDPEPDPGPEAA